MDCIVTGTHAYGPVTDRSDLDIVLKSEDARTLYYFLSDHDIPITYTYENTYDSESFYFTLGEIRVNIISVDREDFAWWRQQTELMKRIPPIKKRSERIKTFQTIVEKEWSELAELWKNIKDQAEDKKRREVMNSGGNTGGREENVSGDS